VFCSNGTDKRQSKQQESGLTATKGSRGLTAIQPPVIGLILHPESPGISLQKLPILIAIQVWRDEKQSILFRPPEILSIPVDYLRQPDRAGFPVDTDAARVEKGLARNIQVSNPFENLFRLAFRGTTLLIAWRDFLVSSKTNGREANVAPLARRHQKQKARCRAH
jgi:hypothetical protein